MFFTRLRSCQTNNGAHDEEQYSSSNLWQQKFESTFEGIKSNLRSIIEHVTHNVYVKNNFR